MPSNFPTSADSFDNAATIHAKKQDGTADPSPPGATYHSDLLGSLGDAIEAVEGWLLGGQISFEAQPGQTDPILVLKGPDGTTAFEMLVENDNFMFRHDSLSSYLQMFADSGDLWIGNGTNQGWMELQAYADRAQLVGRAAAGYNAAYPLIEMKDEDNNPIFTVTPGASGQVDVNVKRGLTRVNLFATDIEGFPEASIYGYVDNQNYWYLDAYEEVGTPANSYTRLYLKAMPSQITSLIDIKDEDGDDIVLVTQPQGGLDAGMGILYVGSQSSDATVQIGVSHENTRRSVLNTYAQDDSASAYVEAQSQSSINADSSGGVGTFVINGSQPGEVGLTYDIDSATAQIHARALVGQTLPLLDLKNENGNDIFTVAPDGSPYAAAVAIRGTQASSNPATRAEFLFFADTNELGTYRESTFKAQLANQAYVTFDAYQDDNTPANSYTTATLQAQVGQTAPLLDLKNENGYEIYTVLPNGTDAMVGRYNSGVNNSLTQITWDVSDPNNTEHEATLTVRASDSKIIFDCYVDDNTPTNSYTTLSMFAAPSQTAPLLELKDENGNDLFSILPAVDGVTAELYGTSNQAKISMYATDDPNADWNEAQIIGRLNSSAKFYLDTYVDNLDPTNSYTTLYLRALTGQTAPLIELKDETNTDTFTITATGVLNFGADVNLYRSQANVLKTDDTFFTTKDVYVQKDHTAAQVFLGEFDTDVPAIVFSTSFDTYWLRAGSALMGTNGGIRFDEHADFSAPAANKATLYARDNGSGKTQIVVRFPTGAVQVIATEP